MKDRTPYFYIIEHVASGKRYAGCRYAKGCDPVEFMTEDGYCTSSNLVKQTIKEEGIESFKIVEIKTQDEVGDVYKYETEFLVKNDCAASDKWLNLHNNTVIAFGSVEFKTAMRTKYGVETPFQSEEIREKSRQTILNHYGVDNVFASPEIKELIIEIHRQNHGVDYYVQSDEFKEKCKQTNLHNCGYEYNLKCPKTKAKIVETNLKKYGQTNYLKTEKARSNVSTQKIKEFENKIHVRILNGDYSCFEYLYDTIDHVFLSGVINSLNRKMKNRYIKISSAKNYIRYKDESTGKIYSIDTDHFNNPVIDFLTQIPYNRKGARKKNFTSHT